MTQINRRMKKEIKRTGLDPSKTTFKLNQISTRLFYLMLDHATRLTKRKGE